MNSNKKMRTIWYDDKSTNIQIIDQRFLPHKLTIMDLKTVDEVIYAIKEMCVRGAPLIGVTGAYGVYIAVKNFTDNQDFKTYINIECNKLKDARPTAVNLVWGVDKVLSEISHINDQSERIKVAKKLADQITEDEVDNCKRIGSHGLKLIHEIYQKKNKQTVNILTHCNAGWLACIEYGTATAPIYTAHENDIDVHVWVDETRPLNQGARLTAWELGKAGIKHTVIADNTGGYLMQNNMVDIVIVGTDRTTRNGDVANKIGTYLKALAAYDNNIPFYVALPSSTFDWELTDGVRSIPIEKRDENEIKYVSGFDGEKITNVLITPESSRAANFAFDVTPAKYVSGFITERGIAKASEKDILELFPEKK